jgi:hypothetical protein
LPSGASSAGYPLSSADAALWALPCNGDTPGLFF